MTNPTQPEQCNEPQCDKPQPQEPVETEASELPVEVPDEVPLPATPQAPEPRRSQRVRRVPKHLKDYVLP